MRLPSLPSLTEQDSLKTDIDASLLRVKKQFTQLAYQQAPRFAHPRARAPASFGLNFARFCRRLSCCLVVRCRVCSRSTNRSASLHRPSPTAEDDTSARRSCWPSSQQKCHHCWLEGSRSTQHTISGTSEAVWRATWRRGPGRRCSQQPLDHRLTGFSVFGLVVDRHVSAAGSLTTAGEFWAVLSRETDWVVTNWQIDRLQFFLRWPVYQLW